MQRHLEEVAHRAMARLITVGRRTGKFRPVDVNFAYREGKVFFLAHGDARWHLNLAANPEAWLEVGNVRVPIRVVWIDQDPYRVREVLDLFRAKYGNAEVRRWYEETARYAVQTEVLPAGAVPSA